MTTPSNPLEQPRRFVCVEAAPGSWRRCLLIAGLLALTVSGCSGAQSALSPAGRSAEQILDLFWWMTGGGIVIWCVVIGLAIYAVRVVPQPHHAIRARLWIIGGGVVVPTITLTVLLIYGLSMLPSLIRPAPPGSLQVDVTGLQWWWRVKYPISDSESVELANEIRMPVGEPVQFNLDSADVIHAFWIPSLGGKVDMIPGRQTSLTLEPIKTGTFRGVCAEYCGASHALMAFDVVVMERDDFDQWLAQQGEPAAEPIGTSATSGREVFLRNGCGACHTIRGTNADGVVGPDLTHVGSRGSLGAGTLPNTIDEFRRWIAHTQTAKPGVEMPNFHMLPEDELLALAAYLEGLK